MYGGHDAGNVSDYPCSVAVTREVLSQVYVSGPQSIHRAVAQPDLRLTGERDEILPPRSDMPVAKKAGL